MLGQVNLVNAPRYVKDSELVIGVLYALARSAYSFQKRLRERSVMLVTRYSFKTKC